MQLTPQPFEQKISSTPMLLFAADPTSPHEQYILDVSAPPLVRYLPYKFRTSQELTDFIKRHTDRINEQHPGKGGLILGVPGYNILLVAEQLNEFTMTFQPILEDTLLHQLLAEETAAPNFYLTFKIQPNGPKYNRYRSN